MVRPPALSVAFSLFTVIPMPAAELDRALAARAILAFPWVGLTVGTGAGLAYGLVVAAGAGPLLAAASALGVLALATGAMHLDGLADTADGLASRKGADQTIAIMKRSDIGPAGVASIVLVLLVDAAALTSPRLAQAGVLAGPAAVAVGAMIGRLSALAGTTSAYAPAHAGGFAALFAGVTRRAALTVDAVACLGITCLVGWAASGLRGLVTFAGAALASWLVGEWWRRRLARRLGGLTGDTWGSLVEIGQLTFWLALGLAL